VILKSPEISFEKRRRTLSMSSVIVDIFGDNFEEALATSDSWQVHRPSVKKNVEKMLMCRTLQLGVKGF